MGEFILPLKLQQIQVGIKRENRLRLDSKKSNLINGYLFILLAIIFFGVFLAYPIIFSISLSFFDWTGFSQTPFKDFIGVDNYVKLINDPVFFLALRNSFIFVTLSLILQNLIGFSTALFLFYSKIRGGVVWRSIIFFPTLLSAVLVGLVWRKILLFDGLINMVIQSIFPNIQLIQWLGNKTTPIFVVTLVSVWQWSGYNMIIYYAGLQSVSKELVESAKIDGANWFQTIIKVVIPQLYKVISLIVVLNIIGGFKVFDIVYVMTGGGPAHASEVLPSYMFFQSFAIMGTNSMGYASTIAVALTFIVLIFSIIRIRIDRRLL